MKKKTRFTLILVILLFIVGMALYPSFQKRFFNKEEVSSPQPTTSVESSTARVLNTNAKIIKHETLSNVFRTIGTLIPDEEVDLTFETSGKITEIHFIEGSEVKKGDLLAKVNDKPLQAELKKLEAQIPLATVRVSRQKTLLEKDAVSQEAYEQVSTELEKLNADIELIKSKIVQTELRAPFDGIIGLRSVSDGAYVTSSTVIATLTKYIPMKLQFSFNEKIANQVRNGTNVTFSVERDMNTYNARVYAVESSIDLNTRTLTARALYANPRGKLKPGRSASVEIVLDKIENAITIPSEAIIAEMGKDIVYLYKDGKAKQVPVTKGIRTESNLQILDGIHVGDTLLVTGIMQLRDGMPVTIINLQE